MCVEQHFKPHRCYQLVISIHLVLLINFPVDDAQLDYEKKYYSECSKNATFKCGTTTLSSISYPFWGDDIRPSYCGLHGFNLSCQRNEIPAIDIGSDSKFRVLKINQSASAITLERYDDVLEKDDVCAYRIKDTKLDTKLFKYSSGIEDLYMFCGCPLTLNTSHMFVYNYTCKSGAADEQIIYGVQHLLSDDDLDKLKKACKSFIRAPIHWFQLEKFSMNLKVLLEEILKSRFELHYYKLNNSACLNCTESGGNCWNGTEVGVDSACLYKPRNSSRKKIQIAASVAISVLFLLLLFSIRYCRIKTRHNSSSYSKDVEDFMRKYGPSIPKRFRYSALKKITNSFKEELGKGGYGNVYKGSLSDGCVVAVKVLNATKGNGEDFMNEVASIGRTSHVNVVSLLGYVYEDKKRALIYEFMRNGSLEKFIHGSTPSLKGQHLSWEKLYSIAHGIARGLEYLHCGCTTQILHFDIKPHNILLDKDFCPKISDFGLAKLYTREQSVLSSIMQARGTIGYIAPEVISRSFGPVSHKSDVYSYGMMILEMVGGRKNVDTRVARTSEVYFPRWVYKHIHVNEETSSEDNVTEEENQIIRKMMIVGLWCIQTNPSERPSISKVIEMFEGNLAALEIPPKPYMCSPPTSPLNSEQKILGRYSSLSESDSSPKILVPRSND